MLTIFCPVYDDHSLSSLCWSFSVQSMLTILCPIYTGHSMSSIYIYTVHLCYFLSNKEFLCPVYTPICVHPRHSYIVDNRLVKQIFTCNNVRQISYMNMWCPYSRIFLQGNINIGFREVWCKYSYKWQSCLFSCMKYI